MYLSKIEMLGFKSFAQRVDLKFDSGVTAIVGPNGCGKTNIVDAIRWALGEQRYSALRSEKMEDLIFNGTKNRKPLGMSEVSLTIQNTKGILPTEYAEVTITRRVYRSGESEYLLNRVPCRLKDILDLFMDTGIGADAYSVIELKMVETILSDRADDRRRLFEEAAGVTRYKHRRKAAYRKLESVQQDLVRVNDIVKEIQKTVNSLERQSKKAEQFNEISQRLRMIEIDLLEREYAYLQGRLQELEAKRSQATAEKVKIDEELAAQDALLDQLRTALRDTEQHLIEVQRHAGAHIDKIHRVEERSLVAQERRSSLHNAIDRYEKEKVDLRTQQEKLQKELITLNEGEMKLSAEIKNTERRYREKKGELETHERALSAQKAELQQRNDESIALIHLIAEKKGEEERFRSRIENIVGSIERARGDNVQYEGQLKEMAARVQRMTAEDKELRRRFVEEEMQLYQEESRKASLKEKCDSLQQKAMDLTMEIERKIAKIDFLRGLIEGGEGGSEGVQYLLSQAHWKRKDLTSVADVVNADEQYRVAVEAALGEAAHLLVVEEPGDAFQAMDELRRSGKGKAAFVVLHRVPRIRRVKRRQKIGAIALPMAADLVKTKSLYRPLINFLLDNVVVAENLEEAKSIVQSAAGVRCVTLDGQIISSTGVVRGGSVRHDEGGFIGKSVQMEELEEDIVHLKKELDGVKAQQLEKINAYDSIDLKPYREAVKAIEKEMTALEIRIAQVEFEKKRAHEATEGNLTDINQFEKEMEEIQTQIETTSRELAKLERTKEGTDRRMLGATSEVESLERQWGLEAKTVKDLEVQLVTLQGELRNTERELEGTQSTLRENSITAERRDGEIVEAHQDIATLTGEIDSQNKELLSLREESKQIERRKQEIEREHAERREEIHRVELKIKDDRRLHDGAVEAVHELELKASELSSNIEHIKERAKKEFEMDLALKVYPDDEWVDFAARQEDVRQLREKIRSLGAINFAAFDEFKAESERLRFLTQQRDDLLEAERTLLSTIEEINNTAQKKFLETFALIRQNFIKTFRGLFDPGDECDLRLEEDLDPLEAPIAIIAKPRGKRPTSIELLSGGEKTLTAIALLFAIYLVKPSPFCILDEVDAPLDDSNIDRYTRILHKFSDNTQFIVVTHNKRTMEAAHALYGVTMEEEGVSKIVTVRFTEGARVESAVVASGV